MARESKTKASGLQQKRERFDDAGRFPLKKVLALGFAVFALIFGGAYGYQAWQAGQAVGGPSLTDSVSYEGTQVAMTVVEATQTAEGLSFPVAEVEANSLIRVNYERTQPMPQEYQQLVGGNSLPILAYVAPDGSLVAASSFCEPCRSLDFHIEGDKLVCNVCFTTWELSTLEGVQGGCLDYPPEEVTAEVRGDQVFLPAADLEAWQPRAF